MYSLVPQGPPTCVWLPDVICLAFELQQTKPYQTPQKPLTLINVVIRSAWLDKHAYVMWLLRLGEHAESVARNNIFY